MNDFELYKRLSFVVSISDEPQPCWVCETPTRYVEINFEAHLCPGICDWTATQAYFMALRGNDPWRENDGESPLANSSTPHVPQQTNSTPGLISVHWAPTSESVQSRAVGDTSPAWRPSVL